MLVTKAVEPGVPAREGVTVGRNVDYPTFLKEIDLARAANNPKVGAYRIKKPTVPPEFAADDRGYLVVIVKDFQLEVPAPPGSERGGLLGAPFKVLRFLVPTAEFTLSYKVAANGANPPTELDAKVEDFVPSGNSKVQMIFEDESKLTTMGPFQANIALLGFKTKLQQLPIKVPLSGLKIPGVLADGDFSARPLGLDASRADAQRHAHQPSGEARLRRPSPARPRSDDQLIVDNGRDGRSRQPLRLSGREKQATRSRIRGRVAVFFDESREPHYPRTVFPAG